MPYSFHSHSGQFCHHGHGTLEGVIQEAIRKKFRVYGLSEHMPRFAESELYPEEIEASCTPETLATTFTDFLKEARQLAEKYRDAIELVVGTEIEFIHQDYAQRVATLRQSHTIDYVVGSLHHVGRTPIDFSQALYDEALNTWGGYPALFAAYFDEQYTMLQAVKPEVVGHFDLVRIFAGENGDQALHDVWDKVIRNIDYIIGYGGLFEINSRAWKKGLRDAYPHRDIIQVIREKGGRFTLSDDCHGPNDVGLYYNMLHDYLVDTHIDSIFYLTRENDTMVIKENKHIIQDPFWQGIKQW